jgi:hypothetical protein
MLPPKSLLTKHEQMLQGKIQAVQTHRDGDYPWHKPPLTLSGWNADGTPYTRAPKPRMMHLIVDLVYSAMMATSTHYLSYPWGNDCVFSLCTLNGLLFVMSYLLRWHRSLRDRIRSCLGLGLAGWASDRGYHPAQAQYVSLLVRLRTECCRRHLPLDGQFPHDRLTVSGQIYIRGWRGRCRSTPGPHPVPVPVTVSVTITVNLTMTLILRIKAFQIMGDVTMLVNFARNTYVNRDNEYALGTARFACIQWLPGLAWRVLWFMLTVMLDGDMGTDAAGTPLPGWSKEWYYLLSVFLDLLMPWLWLHSPTEMNIMPSDTAFTDARFKRIYAISAALIMSCSTRVEWNLQGWGCRLDGILLPAAWVFFIVPLLLTFAQEPGATQAFHADHRSSITFCLHWQLSLMLVVLVVGLAGTLQANHLRNCGNAATEKMYSEKEDSGFWRMSLMAAGILLLSAAKTMCHL